MKNNPQISRDARDLLERLKAEGRLADAMILRRLLQSHVGQANTLRDQDQRLRATASSAAHALRAALASDRRAPQ